MVEQTHDGSFKCSSCYCFNDLMAEGNSWYCYNELIEEWSNDEYFWCSSCYLYMDPFKCSSCECYNEVMAAYIYDESSRCSRCQL